MMRALCVLLIGLVGCDYVFNIGHLDVVDATPPDVPACLASAPRDPFTSTTACAPWGHQTSGGTGTTLVEGNGTLTATISESQQIAGCISNTLVPIDARGMFVAVDHVLATTDAYTTLMLRDENDAWRYSIDESDSMLRMTLNSTTDLHSVPYDATAMRFWRIHLDPRANEIVTDYSADAVFWTELFRAAAPAAQQGYLWILAGLHPAALSPDTAVFSHLNDCP